MVMRKCSLNSKAHGNCSDSCHTHSRNWSMTGDSSLGSPSRWAYLQESQQHTDGQIQNLNWDILNDVWAPLTNLWENLCPKLTQSLSIKTWNANEIKAHNWDVLKRKTKKLPRFFYHESFHGSVERIQKDAGYRACLGRPVPAIRAVHQHTDAFISHCLRHGEDRDILMLLCLLA